MKCQKLPWFSQDYQTTHLGPKSSEQLINQLNHCEAHMRSLLLLQLPNKDIIVKMICHWFTDSVTWSSSQMACVASYHISSDLAYTPTACPLNFLRNLPCVMLQPILSLCLSIRWHYWASKLFALQWFWIWWIRSYSVANNFRTCLLLYQLKGHYWWKLWHKQLLKLCAKRQMV